MNRIRTQRQAEAIACGIELVPERLHPLIGCDFFEGDPHFAGLHAQRISGAGEQVINGRAHCVPGHQACDGRIAVVLFGDDDPLVVLHELGHVIHCNLVDERHVPGEHMPDLWAVNEYATRSYGESFAESFVQSRYPLEMAMQMMAGAGRWEWDAYARWNTEWWDRLLLE